MTTDTKQHLEEWLQDRRDALHRFADDWRLHQRADGLNCWPDKMTPGDWDEQYAAFRGDEE